MEIKGQFPGAVLPDLLLRISSRVPNDIIQHSSVLLLTHVLQKPLLLFKQCLQENGKCLRFLQSCRQKQL